MGSPRGRIASETTTNRRTHREAPVPLPADLIDAIRAASSAQDVDADEAVRAVTVLLAGEDCLGYTVWGGPGYSDDDLKLDVYVLSSRALYNYTKYADGHSVRLVLFLDGITSLGLVDVDDPRSPHVLVIETSEERGRVFGSQSDLRQLEEFQHKIVAAKARER